MTLTKPHEHWTLNTSRLNIRNRSKNKNETKQQQQKYICILRIQNIKNWQHIRTPATIYEFDSRIYLFSSEKNSNDEQMFVYF